MLYRDLVQFDPIESVIQLRSANEKDTAANLVQTYVISDRMADQLANVVIPQIGLSGDIDHKGVLVVGNYGTGKSHLMSVLSALAEHADLVPLVRNADVRDAAAAIGGKFMVVRGEIGSVTKPLRDIVLDELEQFLARVGTPYTFPSASLVSNNKEPLIQAMAAFAAHYPDKGVLFVLDELLDFLRSREGRDLLLDLGFLRELGEVADATPFRFIAGLQETLFDSPRFTFVANELRRVKDRFEQVQIARQDIAFVVAERLLRKNDAQLARINEHLRRFSGLYPQMADRLSEYAQLFPIHPAYIDTFERVYLAEKREVLQTFSRAIGAVLDEQVPEDQPGLISYDQYWDTLRANPSLRTLPEVAEVVQKSNVLLGRVENAYTKPPLKSMALRIVHALSVQRLTSELDRPLGVTAEELRDQLCLWLRMPESSADFLLDQVRVALREITRTVNGQYISFNEDNGQYYLDLKKDIDFDARIEDRGNFFGVRDLNQYFYSILQGLLTTLPATSYVTSFLIWPYQLPWREKNVTRPGYLFLGSPRERSTAQPPRDFYLYFLPPFGEPEPRLEEHPDEVAFALAGVGAELTELVRRYAGAQAQAQESTNHRAVYADKADVHRRAVAAWLREHLVSHLRVTHRGTTQTIPQILARTRSSASTDIEDMIRIVAGHLLEPHFRESYPEYPAFTRLTQPITEQTREVVARDAVIFLARGTRTQLAVGVLRGLGLLNDDEKVRTADSLYGQHLLALLKDKPNGQVVNHGEVLVQVTSGTVPVLKDPRFHLEPEWIAVVLLALVYDGEITLNLGNETLDAGTIERAALLGMDRLTDFRFYRRPQELPLHLWRQIFEALDLPPGLVQDESTRGEAALRLQERVAAEVGQVAATVNRVQSGVTLWGVPLFTDNRAFVAQPGGFVSAVDGEGPSLTSTEVLPHLRRAKEFLDKLASFNSPGKMRNLPLTSDDLKKALASRGVARHVIDVLRALDAIQPLSEYLGQALVLLPSTHPWLAQAVSTREELLADARRAIKDEKTPFDVAAWRTRLTELRRTYVDAYVTLHRQYVLGPEEDDRRARLTHDARHERLATLAKVDTLNAPELARWDAAVKGMLVCRNFHAELLEATPECPHCHFRPAQAHGGQASADSRLRQLDQQLDLMVQQWDVALRNNLKSETAQASRRNMTVAERRPLDAYLATADVETPLPPDLVASANQALHGLRMLQLEAAELMGALAQGGFPCTEADLRQRFDAFLRQRMQGYDARNTRISIGHETVTDSLQTPHGVAVGSDVAAGAARHER